MFGKDQLGFWAFAVVATIAGMALLGAFLYVTYQWGTTGSDWFIIIGYRFHKVSFLVGLATGGIFLGGGSSASTGRNK